MECPNKECKEKVSGHGLTLYGTDGMGGLVKSILEKVSSKTVRSYFFVLLSAFVVLSVGIVNAWSDARGEREANLIKIKVIQTELKGFQKSVDKIDGQQTEMMKRQIETQQLLEDMIKMMEKED